MIKIIAQLVLSLAVVELVPANFAAIETAHLPEAGEGYPVVQEVSSLLSPSIPIDRSVRPPIKTDAYSLGIVTTASSAVVVDKGSGEILFEKNIDERRPIGSLTKLMTAIVFLDTQPDMDLKAAVTKKDVRLGGRDHLYLDDYVTIEHLLESSLIGSDNPATMSLMRLSGLTQEEFVEKMNETAHMYGMMNSRFTEPTGLDSKNISTAREIVLLLRHALDYADIRNITTKSTSTFNSDSGREYTIPTTNLLLGSYLNDHPFSIVGGKTGFLPSAGYCLGLEITDGDDHSVFSVVLGSDTQLTRFQEVKGLTQWAFDTFTWPDET